MRPVAIAFVALSVLVTAVTSYFAFLPQSSGTVAFWVLAAGADARARRLRRSLGEP